MASKIYVGIGGWTFEPWRGTFYPDDLTQKRELEYASRQLTSIEINGTYYGTQKRTSFERPRGTPRCSQTRRENSGCADPEKTLMLPCIQLT